MLYRFRDLFLLSIGGLKRALHTSPASRFVFASCLTISGGAAIFLLLNIDSRVLNNALEADYVTKFLTAFAIDERHPSTPVTFIDIDEGSYAAWNNPKIIPRHHLVDLLAIADAGRPAAVVLDFDITQDDQKESEEFKNFLMLRDETSAPALLLIMPLRRLPAGRDVEGAVVERQKPDSPAEKWVGARWVTALLDAEDDWFLRSWQGYHAVCADGQPRAYPAVALATTAITYGGRSGLAQLDTWLKQAANQRCVGGRIGGGQRQPTAYWLKNAAETMTIPYAVGFPTINFARFGFTTVDGRSFVRFARFSAKELAGRKQQLLESPLDLDGRIVVIGASYETSGDWHRTPLGRMPGMYVLGNMIAFGAGALEENRWGGMKPFLLGLALFSLHAMASAVFRAPVAAAFLLLGGGILVVGAVRVGMTPATAYEGALFGLGLATLYVSIYALLDAITYERRYPRVGRLGHFLLSDDGCNWLSTWRDRRQ